MYITILTAAQAKVTGQPVTVETAGTDSDETAGAEETRTGTEEIHQIGRRRADHISTLSFSPSFRRLEANEHINTPKL